MRREFDNSSLNSILSQIDVRLNSNPREVCTHAEIVLVYGTGRKIRNGIHEKDFVVRCNDCEEELLRKSMIGRK